MCTPIFALFLGMAGTMAGAQSQAQGQQQAAESRATEYRYQAEVDQNNKEVEEWKASDAIARGKVEEDVHRIKVSQLKGRQRAVIAAQGREVDSGSALDILGDTAELGELDALTIRSNAEREEYEHNVRASNLGANKEMKLLAANNAIKAGNIAARTSLLQGVGSVASKWYDYTN